jgi:hypothetical protein
MSIHSILQMMVNHSEFPVLLTGHRFMLRQEGSGSAKACGSGFAMDWTVSNARLKNCQQRLSAEPQPM